MTPPRGRPPKYPWRTIAIGESFFAPAITSNQLQNTARKYHQPKRFKCRKVMIKGVTGTRVERII